MGYARNLSGALNVSSFRVNTNRCGDQAITKPKYAAEPAQGRGTMSPTPNATDAVERLKSVFRELPGTQLSLVDASRLSGVEPPVCRVLLEALEEAQFLARTRTGLFVRRSSDSPLA
jgi:hypothetical protein